MDRDGKNSEERDKGRDRVNTPRETKTETEKKVSEETKIETELIRKQIVLPLLTIMIAN